MAATSCPSTLGAPNPLVHLMSSDKGERKQHPVESEPARFNRYVIAYNPTHLHGQFGIASKGKRTRPTPKRDDVYQHRPLAKTSARLPCSFIRLTVNPIGSSSSDSVLPKLSVMNDPKHSAQKSNLSRPPPGNRISSQHTTLNTSRQVDTHNFCPSSCFCSSVNRYLV